MQLVADSPFGVIVYHFEGDKVIWRRQHGIVSRKMPATDFYQLINSKPVEVYRTKLNVDKPFYKYKNKYIEPRHVSLGCPDDGNLYLQNPSTNSWTSRFNIAYLLTATRSELETAYLKETVRVAKGDWHGSEYNFHNIEAIINALKIYKEELSNEQQA